MVDPGAPKELVAYFHNVELQPSDTILAQYYYARFAWTVLRPRSDLTPQLVPRGLQVQVFDGGEYQTRAAEGAILDSAGDEPNILINPPAEIDCRNERSPGISVETGWSDSFEWNGIPYYSGVTVVEEWKRDVLDSLSAGEPGAKILPLLPSPDHHATTEMDEVSIFFSLS